MIRPSVPTDAIALAPRLRGADVREIASLSGSDPLAALTMGYMHSQPCITGMDSSGKVIAMGGVVPFADDPTSGAVWFLSSEEIKDNVREYVTEARAWLQKQLKRYRVLTNIVTEDNTLHRRLIKFMGFTFSEPVNNYGAGMVRVIPFHMTGERNV